MRWLRLILISVTTLVTVCHAQTKPEAQNWNDFSFLLGNWVGIGNGTPGEGAGEFSLQPDLQGTVLVRKNFAMYPATASRAAFRHDDLMIVYHAQGGNSEAMYFDNEGHVIAYHARVPDPHTVVFVSDSGAGGPHFRLTYSRISQDSLNIQFDIAPPNKPNEFSVYIAARAYRK